MHELMRRTGSANPNQFAQWFDEATASWADVDVPSRKPSKKIKQVTATKDQKKWYPIIRGEQALSPKGLAQLSKLFPDAGQYFLEGPGRLWEALWGPVHQLWSIAASIGYDTPYRPDPEIDAGEAFTGPDLSFEESLYNFECSLLLRDRRFLDEEIELRDLADSIALYRLHQVVNSVGATDGVGAYRCVRMCMDAAELWDQFDAFNTFSAFCVYGAINRELVDMEIRRLKYEPSYRKSVGVSAADIERYAKWPGAFCSEEERMDVLRISRSPSDIELKVLGYLEWLENSASPTLRESIESRIPHLARLRRVKDYKS
ncbi:hypothetical protein [Paraburkholderia caledonica]|uniref:hypothetical protein n=1 Tax=Paraburkholderia caledonica TaxID=134536 RepID=UPI0004804202|nr:hypothetical protein [Paraburkholderia caledonica]